MEIQPTSWLEDFEETCQDIQEDVLLLQALAAYPQKSGETNRVFSSVLRRVSEYLSQHAWELRRLEKRFRPDPQ